MEYVTQTWLHVMLKPSQHANKGIINSVKHLLYHTYNTLTAGKGSFSLIGLCNTPQRNVKISVHP